MAPRWPCLAKDEPPAVRDILLLSFTLTTFAVLVTAHCAVAVGLFGRRPRWRAPLAFALFPLAPYFALRERMTWRAAVWIASALAYVLGRWLSWR